MSSKPGFGLRRLEDKFCGLGLGTCLGLGLVLGTCLGLALGTCIGLGLVLEGPGLPLALRAAPCIDKF